MDSPQDLLFGALALRLDSISAEQFAEACITWSTRTDRPRLAELLVERGWMTRSECDEIERQLGEADGDKPLDLPELDSGVQEGAPSLADMELPGVRGGRYTIQEFRGEGGAGCVYIALDHVLNREVALKEVKPEMSRSSLARRRLLREVQITGQLEHPSIVPIYDLAGQVEGDTPFYTMRLVRGQLLQEAFADYHARLETRAVHPLELPRLLRALISICNAISYAHSRGVIHRDLKPENVVLGRFGEVVLLDWGLAKLVGGAARPEETESVGITADAKLKDTVVGLAVGTPAYMAPEQVTGGSGPVDVRTDVYGLGAILFELLTGRAPHVGDDSAEVLTRIASEATPRARDIESSAPPALDGVCARAMALNLENRYATAQDMADDLERFLADEPVLAYPGGLAHRLGSWARRNRTWTLAAAAALLITIAVTTTAAVRLGNMAAQEREAREHSLWVAAKIAAEKIANEIDLRWHYLKDEAADSVLRTLVRASEDWDDLAGSSRRSELETWIADKHGKYSGAARSNSWFLQDGNGRHLARSPPDPGIVGDNFAYRDYFHGRGQDYAEGTETSPIQEFHRSIVFKSAATDNLIVAFTTPVWDEKGVEVIGILGMTVELGDFAGLHANLGSDHLAVLVDTKNDWIEADKQTGLILHHPGLNPQGQGVFRIRSGLVNNLQILRRLELGRRARLRMLSEEEKLALYREPLLGSLDSEYQDAVGGRYEGGWLAAFEPVIVSEGTDDFGDTGWIVIVQQRRN